MYYGSSYGWVLDQTSTWRLALRKYISNQIRFIGLESSTQYQNWQFEMACAKVLLCSGAKVGSNAWKWLGYVGNCGNWDRYLAFSSVFHRWCINFRRERWINIYIGDGGHNVEWLTGEAFGMISLLVVLKCSVAVGEWQGWWLTSWGIHEIHG